DVEPAGRAVHHSSNLLDVRVPPPGRTAMGVGHPHAESGLLPADVADGCHGLGMVAAATGGAHARAGQEAGGTLAARRRLRNSRAPSPRKNRPATTIAATMPTRLEPVGARAIGPDVRSGVVGTTEGEE